MPTSPHPPETLVFVTQVEETYVSLMRFASPGEDSLGGKLLYVGELDEAGRILAIAGNISGAATLAASAQAATLRQAMHAGVVDFLVSSPDEALRILKNEIRKREPVSVAVSIAPQAIAQQMLDRGVLPDLLPPHLPSAPGDSSFDTFIAQGAQRIAPSLLPSASKLLIWQIPTDFAQRPAEFDALLLEHLPTGDHAATRWLRQSPRYLGPQFRRLRSLRCGEETGSKLINVLGSPLQN